MKRPEPRTVEDVIRGLVVPHSPEHRELPAPKYNPPDSPERKVSLGLCVESMRDHTSSEGWEIFRGLQEADWLLAGKCYPSISNSRLDWSGTDVAKILTLNPQLILLQDKREWDLDTSNKREFRDPEARFQNVHLLRDRHDVFKLTILKDAHQRPHYHRASADEIGCHAWVIYYHPRIVHHLAPYTRARHLIRTWHSVDGDRLPSFDASGRQGCLLSGAIGSAYPLRKRLVQERGLLPDVTYLPHPGYHRNGCHTPEFLKILSQHRVAICTSSVYGYALRKIVEATACGCRVLTDLPVDDELPHIDGNLVRIHPSLPTASVASVLRDMLETYDPEKQEQYARKALAWYDYRKVGERLSWDIEQVRRNYPCSR